MLIVQNPSIPSRVRDALIDVIGSSTVDAQVAVAYTTKGGVKIFMEVLRAAVGDAAFESIPKTLITSLDYGITEPSALELWAQHPNSIVEISGIDLLAAGSLVPRCAFHPKIYSFGVNSRTCSLLVGSANLTSRAFSINTEAVWTEESVPRSSITEAIAIARNGVTGLTDELLEAYRKLRRRQPPPPRISIEGAPVSKPAPVLMGSLHVFRSAVESGLVDLQAHRGMWIQVDKLSGGAQSQLELPRGAHRFFGFTFDQYSASSKVTIGKLELRNGRKAWNDKLLTWHGNNMMERINLPTVSTGGFTYADSAVLFRRLGGNAYELLVVAWDSDLARSWRQASADTQRLFRFGGSSKRVVGLLS